MVSPVNAIDKRYETEEAFLFSIDVVLVANMINVHTEVPSSFLGIVNMQSSSKIATWGALPQLVYVSPL